MLVVEKVSCFCWEFVFNNYNKIAGMYRLALRWTRTLPKDSTQFAGHKMHIIPLGGLPGCLHAARGPHLAGQHAALGSLSGILLLPCFPDGLKCNMDVRPGYKGLGWTQSRIQGTGIDSSPGYKGLAGNNM